MATIEPRLMHLLNGNDSQAYLPSIHSTLGGTSDNPEDTANLLLPPLELNTESTKQQQQQHQQHQHQQISLQQHHQQQLPLHSTLQAIDKTNDNNALGSWHRHSLLRVLTSDVGISAGNSSGTGLDPSFPSGLDDLSPAASASIIGKRSRIPTHTDELIQLPQPLKKQKSSQQVGSLSQVFPPIINGLHEPPPNAAVFPPIASAEFDGEAAMNRNVLPAEYGDSSLNGVGGSSINMVLDPLPESASKLPVVPTRLGNIASVLTALPGQNGQKRLHATSMTESSETPGGAEEEEEEEEAVGAPPPKPKRRAKKPRRRWTDEETNQLLIGVSRHGLGKWTAILEDPEFSFGNRTAGDLKDRFRTCCPNELRGPLSKSDLKKSKSPDITSPTILPPPSPPSLLPRNKSKMSLKLGNILIEARNSDDLDLDGPLQPNDRHNHNNYNTRTHHDNRSNSNDQNYHNDADTTSDTAVIEPPNKEVLSGGGYTSTLDLSQGDQPKGRRRRVHRRNMDDMFRLGIQGPFKKSHRRERRPFTEQDDKEILDGLDLYGPAWSKIHRHPGYNLSSRQPTDLRDRVRNKYPEIYAKIEKGTFQPAPASPEATSSKKPGKKSPVSPSATASASATAPVAAFTVGPNSQRKSVGGSDKNIAANTSTVLEPSVNTTMENPLHANTTGATLDTGHSYLHPHPSISARRGHIHSLTSSLPHHPPPLTLHQPSSREELPQRSFQPYLSLRAEVLEPQESSLFDIGEASNSGFFGTVGEMGISRLLLDDPQTPPYHI